MMCTSKICFKHLSIKNSIKERSANALNILELRDLYMILKYAHLEPSLKLNWKCYNVGRFNQFRLNIITFNLQHIKLDTNLQFSVIHAVVPIPPLLRWQIWKLSSTLNFLNLNSLLTWAQYKISFYLKFCISCRTDYKTVITNGRAPTHTYRIEDRSVVVIFTVTGFSNLCIICFKPIYPSTLLFQSLTIPTRPKQPTFKHYI